MSIFRGGVEIQPGDLQLGSAPVQAVYRGGTLLWPPPSTGGGTNLSTLYRQVNPVSGLYMPYNGWEPTAGPPPGDHSHFDAIAADPDAVYSLALRSQADIDVGGTTGRPGNTAYQAVWSYDPLYDAALLNFFAGFRSLSLTTNEQLFMDFPRVDVAAGETFSLQYEIMYDQQFQDTSLSGGWEGIHKTIRLDHREASPLVDQRNFECNNDSRAVLRDYAAQPRVRSYIQPRDLAAPPWTGNGDEKLTIDHSAFATNGRRYPISLYQWDNEGTRPGGPQTPQWDRQPSNRTSLDFNQLSTVGVANHLARAAGDVNEPFLHLNNIIARATIYWTYEDDGDLRFEYWMADENTDPVQIIGHKDTLDGTPPGSNEGKGLNTWNAGAVVYPAIPGTGQSAAGDYFQDNAVSRIRCEFKRHGPQDPARRTANQDRGYHLMAAPNIVQSAFSHPSGITGSVQLTLTNIQAGNSIVVLGGGLNTAAANIFPFSISEDIGNYTFTNRFTFEDTGVRLGIYLWDELDVPTTGDRTFTLTASNNTYPYLLVLETDAATFGGVEESDRPLNASAHVHADGNAEFVELGSPYTRRSDSGTYERRYAVHHGADDVDTEQWPITSAIARPSHSMVGWYEAAGAQGPVQTVATANIVIVQGTSGTIRDVSADWVIGAGGTSPITFANVNFAAGFSITAAGEIQSGLPDRARIPSSAIRPTTPQTTARRFPMSSSSRLTLQVSER